MSNHSPMVNIAYHEQVLHVEEVDVVDTAVEDRPLVAMAIGMHYRRRQLVT